jgi:hypothetical protein
MNSATSISTYVTTPITIGDINKTHVTNICGSTINIAAPNVYINNLYTLPKYMNGSFTAIAAPTITLINNFNIEL